MSSKKHRGYDIDEAPVPSSSAARVRPEDLVDTMEFSKNWKTIRAIGQVFAYGNHWVTTKKRDGSRGAFKVPCLAFDSETGETDSTIHCPWCKHREEHPGSKDKPGLVGYSTEYWFNAIDRKEQDNPPKRPPRPDPEEVKSGFKLKDSDTWTPVKAVRLSAQDLRKVRNLKDLNRIKTKSGEVKVFSVFDERQGRDVNISFNKDEKVPSNRFQVNIGDKAPLNEEEAAYLTWDISSLEEVMTPDEADKEYDRWASRMGVSGGEDEDEDRPKRKTKSEKDTEMKKSANDRLRNALDDDEDDDDEDEPPRKSSAKKSTAKKVAERYIGVDDEDDIPVKKSSAKKSSSKKVVDDEDDDEDDEEDDIPVKKSSTKKPSSKKVIDDDDEDEDDEPPKSKKPLPSKSKKVVDDDDEDDDDEDDEDDVPVKKSSVKKPTAKKVVDEDDEDDDEDEPPKSKKPVPSKSKKVVDDDEDDEDDEDDDIPVKKSPPKKSSSKKVVDDDEDDEDEDEPPRKSAAKKPTAKKAAPARKKAQDDDDDF
jgi:hypothetical protein